MGRSPTGLDKVTPDVVRSRIQTRISTFNTRPRRVVSPRLEPFPVRQVVTVQVVIRTLLLCLLQHSTVISKCASIRIQVRELVVITGISTMSR